MPGLKPGGGRKGPRSHDAIRTCRTHLAAEALRLLDPDDPTVRAIAGGTALMLMMKAGVFRPTRLVSLRKLDGSIRASRPPMANSPSAP